MHIVTCIWHPQWSLPLSTHSLHCHPFLCPLLVSKCYLCLPCHSSPAIKSDHQSIRVLAPRATCTALAAAAATAIQTPHLEDTAAQILPAVPPMLSPPSNPSSDSDSDFEFVKPFHKKLTMSSSASLEHTAFHHPSVRATADDLVEI